MSEKTKSFGKKESHGKSGVMPLPILEPLEKREPPMPRTLPELDDRPSGSTTGLMPIVTEGVDTSAEREQDPASPKE